MATPRAFKRISLARGIIFGVLILFVVVAFVLHLGVLSWLVRGVLVLGLFAFAVSYVVEFLVKWRARRER